MPVKIIAEAGINWQGDMNTAYALCDMAQDCGADCIKFQIFSPLEGLPDWPWVKQLEIADYCKTIGIEYSASCFDSQAVGFLLKTDPPFIKIGSGEITNYALIETVAKSGKPMILSTGMSVMDEIFTAVAVFHNAGGKDYVLMHCTSNYPTDPKHCNVAGVETLRYNFRAENKFKATAIGFSDHCLSDAPAIMAYAYGATVFEKHITLSRSLPGPDHHMSLEPEGFKRYVQNLRDAELCEGDGNRNTLQPGEEQLQQQARGRWNF